MPETQIVLISLLAMGLVTLLGGFTVLILSHTKNRIIKQQQRFLEAERRLRRTQEAFTDNAHHELRTPIQILVGYLQLLQDLDPRPDQRPILEKIQGATSQLANLVQGLLDLSSLGQGTLSTTPVPTNLAPCLAGLAMCFQAGARAKGLDLQVDLAPLPDRLVCDAARLSQALEALLDNAVKFTDRGRVDFRMTSQLEGQLCRLRFEIQDAGPGLPADWARLIQPFEQEEHGFRRRHGGLGIGLPLAHGIIERLGGRIGLQPLQTGTLAWVELRLEGAEDSQNTA